MQQCCLQCVSLLHCPTDTLILRSVVIYAVRALRRLPGNASLSTKSIYYGLGLVGLCSSLFHGLLSYHAQMGWCFDDAPLQPL